jgi:hypothetical protein
MNNLSKSIGKSTPTAPVAHIAGRHSTASSRGTGTWRLDFTSSTKPSAAAVFRATGKGGRRLKRPQSEEGLAQGDGHDFYKQCSCHSLTGRRALRFAVVRRRIDGAGGFS